MHKGKYELAIYTPFDKLTTIQTNKVAAFLHDHLDEYGDRRKDITKAIQYAMKETAGPGGFVLTLNDPADEIVGAVVINKTGMEGYIPENILVYIAVHREHRGEGIGKALLKATIDHAKGDIALHVEPDNPAKFLYERLGFEHKYHEMRLKNPS